MSIEQFSEIELAGEEWRDVPGFVGIQVSDLGRLRTRWRNRGSKRWLADGWEPKKTSPDTYGYMQTRMPGRRLRLVHQLVLESFVSPKPPGLQSRHLDGVNTNNRANNLIWGTGKENGQDRVRHGTNRPGEQNGLSVMADADVVECRRLYAAGGVTMAELAERIGVDPRTLPAAIIGKTYRHLPEAVPMPEGRKHRGDNSGERNSRAKISNETAALIRGLYSQGISRKEISQRTEASSATVGKIVRGDRWVVIPGSEELRADVKRFGNSKLSEDDVREIRRLHESGLNYREISDKFKVTPECASNIVRRKSYASIV